MNFALSRKLIVFGLTLPLAVIVGFTLATPYEQKTFLLMAVVTSVLLLPIMLKWYHPLLIFSLNAWINVYFLPGKPQLWMLVSAIGFGIAILNSTLDRDKPFIHIPALTLPLLFFVAVVIVTAKLTGGMGVRALGGSTFGGKGYFHILFGAMAYFVLTSKAIPWERVKTYLSVFFLSGATSIVSNLAYMLGPAFYFLYYLFPVDFAIIQASADRSFGTEIVRLTGLAATGAAVYFCMMVRFGIRGIFDSSHPWRLPCLVLAVCLCLLGGFRSLLIAIVIQFIIQFYFERLVRTRLCVFLTVGAITGAALLLPFVSKMPLSVQRCVAVIPGAPVSPMAKADAESSTRWRVEMWQVLLPEIPKYLMLGKGYALNPADLYLANQAMLQGIAKNYEVALVAGNYHNGPLSLIIPFGIFGAVGFLWLLAAGIWVLYRNYRYGDPGMQLVNTFLLAYFIGRVIIFFGIFGALDVEFYKFTGVLGLSVSINRGVRKRVGPGLAPAPTQLQPALA